MTDNVIPLAGRLPAGVTAEDTGQWQAGQTDRAIYGQRRHPAGRPDVTVTAAAVQLRDGTITDERHVLVAGADSGLTPAEARALAEQLHAAADELDAW